MSETVIPELIDIQEILRLLPHRYPFVMIDRVTRFDLDEGVVAIKNVTINEPFFQGHFPSRPIMPGVLILEGMAQAGGVYAFYSVPENIGKKLLYFAGIDKARFRRPVVPGDQIEFRLKLLKRRRDIWKLAGEAFVDNVLVAEAELTASFA
ncbi:MAG: 3-hydroxyacyl-ACP dehydratase FabZ [Desulfobulbaceae bacterium]|uniref:3-hydroxyacyl-[acyl-carrier-protein] dehydratase FabZ n=1 Tax=Candidatus Desulfatifera sulfidica TaxID=2841691 RepID=A0A8J6T9H8_9BACT|nr:3-hydroxyacyl-ACP dehydratase FabZ [Candidatus Desulfatifera sulfidica]